MHEKFSLTNTNGNWEHWVSRVFWEIQVSCYGYFPTMTLQQAKKEPQWFSTIFGTSKNSSDVIRANMRCVTPGKNNQSIFGSSVGLSHSFLSCPLRHFAFEIVMDRFWIYTTMMSNKFPSDCDGNPTDQNIDTSLELEIYIKCQGENMV